MRKKIRVVIAKLGLDSHNRGLKIVARALRDAGMEVIYAGRMLNVETIVSMVLQESPDVLGISILSGAHNLLLPRLTKALLEKDVHNLSIIVGGIIPDSDINELKACGIDEVFGPGTPTSKIIKYIRSRPTFE